MRKINTILSVLLLVIFMLHGLMGSFMLLGIGSSAGKILAWVGVAVLAAHTVIGVILTINTLKISKNAGNSYLKQNAVFWARRASGLAILILMFFHIGLFGGVQDGIYILFPFTTVKLITQLLLVEIMTMIISLTTCDEQWKVDMQGYGIRITTKGVFGTTVEKPKVAVCPKCGEVSLYIENFKSIK